MCASRNAAATCRRMWIARVLHEFGERDAVEILHHVVRLSLRSAAEVVDLDRVRMQQLAGQLHFALEAMHELVGRDMFLQDLDRGRPLQQRMAGEVDRRHAAFAHLALQGV
jgi:hypothetical protein